MVVTISFLVDRCEKCRQCQQDHKNPNTRKITTIVKQGRGLQRNALIATAAEKTSSHYLKPTSTWISEKRKKVMSNLIDSDSIGLRMIQSENFLASSSFHWNNSLVSCSSFFFHHQTWKRRQILNQRLYEKSQIWKRKKTSSCTCTRRTCRGFSSCQISSSFLMLHPQH